MDILKEAFKELQTVTDNQQGMPDHLMKVSRLFGEAKDNIHKLEKEARKQSIRWRKNLNGNSSSNRNNNNNKNKTKKRKRSINYNSYFNNSNNEKK